MTTCANGSSKPTSSANWCAPTAIPGRTTSAWRPSCCNTTPPRRWHLFDDIPGYPKGFRVLTNFFGGRRQNMTLGFSPDLNKIELSEAFLADFQKISDKPLPYQVVETGPVMENVIEGDAIDVTRFPTPVWHDRDEGRRYIGTGSFNVTRDPDEDWVNAGTYRVMIHDAKRLGFYISPGKHGRIHRDKYQALNKPMPVCIVIGGDPLTFLMACTEVPYGICEYEIAGAYRGRPQKVVIGKHTGLPYPANAEIVIEGFVQPGNNMPEGPFGEWTGYYGSKMRAEPVLDIKAIYHRNDPIILGCPPQRPPEEQARYRAVMRSALLKQELKKTGLPDVVATWCHEAGGSRQLTAVSIKQRYPGHARQAGHLAAMCRSVAYAGKYVIVVDDDIDVSNLERADVGGVLALGPGDLDRFHPQRLVDAARSVDPAGEKGEGRLHQQPRHHRRLPAVPLEGPVSDREHAAAGNGAPDQGDVLLDAGRKSREDKTALTLFAT